MKLTTQKQMRKQLNDLLKKCKIEEVKVESRYAEFPMYDTRFEDHYDRIGSTITIRTIE